MNKNEPQKLSLGGGDRICNEVIRFEDKELFALALTAVANGKTVNFYWNDNDDYKSIEGWNNYWNCRLVSLWMNLN